MQETFTKTMQENSVIADRIMAQIVKITDLQPIPGADRIELAFVLGWQVVVQKGQFQINDLAIYFNIDSVLDSTHVVTAKLAADLKFKPLKTVKIRGVLSQGLLTSLNNLISYNTEFTEGDNVTEILNVRKYVESEEANLYDKNASRTSWPLCIPKTDESRLQNSPKLLNSISDKDIIITQKYDGTSTTFLTLDGKFSVCSRNQLILDVTDNNNRVYLEMATKYNLSDNMLKLNKNLAIQGETIGPKINGNKHGVSENSFYVFNIYDIDGKKYLSWDNVVDICQMLNLNLVPVVYRGKCVLNCLKDFLDLSDKQLYNTGKICEGIVVKSDCNDSNDNDRISFKVISNKYLLKYKL